jgi:hypothetical protein
MQEQHLQPSQPDRVEGEAVAGEDAGGLLAQERPPSAGRSPWCRVQSVAAQRRSGCEVHCCFRRGVCRRGIAVLATPVRANAYAELRVGTIRREVLDRILILGCRQLQAVLSEYADHRNVYRPHRALGQAPPLRSGEPAVLVAAGASCGEIGG